MAMFFWKKSTGHVNICRLVGNTKQICQYADEYLVFIAKAEFSRTIHDVLRSFAEEGLGLIFTFETAKE